MTTTAPATTKPGASFAGFALQSVDDMASDYARVLIHGPQGSGKSTLASTIASTGKTLYIDLVGEKGVRSFQGAPYAKNIEVIRPDSITALDDIFWALDGGDHDYKAVVIDSLTAVQKMAMRYILGYDETSVREIRQGASPADRASWGRTLDIMTDTATFWFGLADAQRERPIHVVMTAQTKVVTNEDGDLTDRSPDVQKGALSIVLAAPDYILYTDVEKNLDAIGDDSVAPVNHIVRFGADPLYRTKGRIPISMRGKLRPILGRESQVSLTTLGRALGMGGIPAAPAKKATEKDTKE